MRLYTKMHLKVGNLARRRPEFKPGFTAPKASVAARRSRKPIFEFIWVYFLFFALPLYAEIQLNQLSLADAEITALEYNKELLISREGTVAARERASQATSRWFPSLSYFAEFRGAEKKELFFDVFSSTLPFSHSGYSSVFELKQPLFSSDLLYGLKSKRFEAESFLFEQASTKNELLFSVRKSYYAVVFFETALTIERENIDYLNYALECEEQKLKAGNSTPFEVNQSKVAVANAISLYYLTLKELKNARNTLILTLGINPLLEPKMALSQKSIPLTLLPEISLRLQLLQQQYNTLPLHLDHLEQARELTLFTEKEALDYLEEALAHRPDLHRSQSQVRVAEQNLKAKQGEYFPRLSSYVRYSYNDAFLGPHPYFSQTYRWTGGLQLGWNLFDSFLREHDIREARALRQASQIHYEKKIDRIEIEIRNSLYQLEETLFAYLSSSRAAALAEQAREQAQDKLEFGRIAPLEYRDSVNLLAAARNQQNRASLELITAYYQLRYARGVDGGVD